MHYVSSLQGVLYANYTFKAWVPSTGLPNSYRQLHMNISSRRSIMLAARATNGYHLRPHNGGHTCHKKIVLHISGVRDHISNNPFINDTKRQPGVLSPANTFPFFIILLYCICIIISRNFLVQFILNFPRFFVHTCVQLLSLFQ